MVLKMCYNYFAEMFSKAKVETLLILLFMAVILVILVKICCVLIFLMFMCVRKIKLRRHSPTSHEYLCSRCSEETWLLMVPPIENRTSVQAQLGKQQSFHSLSWISKSWILAFSLSLMWEFIRVYQSKVAERASIIVKSRPAVCDPLTMSIFDSVKEFLRQHFSWTHGIDVCNDYYHAMLVDPLWEVSP